MLCFPSLAASIPGSITAAASGLGLKCHFRGRISKIEKGERGEREKRRRDWDALGIFELLSDCFLAKENVL